MQLPASTKQESAPRPQLSKETLTLPRPETLQGKESPLTDIGTSPPPFDLPSLDDKRSGPKDSYESSELSDLDDDELEAETDKMDFLDDDTSSGPGDKVSDLHALSELTELARLQEVDSDDSDESFVGALKRSISPPQLNNGDADLGSVKRELDDSEDQPDAKKAKVEDQGSDDNLEHVEDQAASKDVSPSVNRASNGNDSEVADKHQSEEPEEQPEDEQDASLEEQEDIHNEIDEKAAEGDEPGDDAEEVVESKAGKVAQTKLAVEAEALASLIEKKEEEDISNENTELSLAEAQSSEADAEADVEDVVKQEELEEQSEQEKAEAAEAEAAKNAESPAYSNEDDEDQPDDVDLDEHRKLAVEELISIEIDFAHLRDKLYHDKLGLLEHELLLCLDGSHPELLQIYYKVNEFYQDNIQLANLTLNYSLKCINNETVATRTAIHQDFLRKLMDMKNEMVTETTSLWYKINRERNYLDLTVPDCNFTAIPSISEDKATFGANGAESYQEGPSINKKLLKQNTLIELVQQRNSLNEQLGILNGLTEFHGLPSAVSTELMESGEFPAEELLLRKAAPEEINEDLRAMGIY